MKMDNVGKQYNKIMEMGYGKALSMYPGTLLYARVLADPFLIDSARIPVFPILSTSLENYYATGKGSTNSDGNGWIMVHTADFLTSDIAGVYYSNSTSGTGMGVSPSTAPSNSPHPVSQFTTGTGTYSARIVALGIRVRYTGTNLNAAGTLVTGQMSPLGDSMSGLSYSQVKQLPGFKEYEFNKNVWHSVIRLPEDQKDNALFEWDGATRWVFPDSNAHPFDDNFRIGIYIAGATGQQPYEWEVRGHYELYGTNLPRRGIVKSDQTGVEHVVGTLQTRRHKDSVTPEHNVGKSDGSLLNILKEGAKQAIPLIPSVVSKLLTFL